MSDDPTWKPLDPNDIEPVAKDLRWIDSSTTPLLLAIGPADPPTVETKGFLGRKKHVVVDWGATVMHSEGTFTAYLVFPDGALFTQRVPQGMEPWKLDYDGEKDATFHLLDPVDHDAAAAALLFGIRAALGDAVEDRWRYCVGEGSVTW